MRNSFQWNFEALTVLGLGRPKGLLMISAVAACQRPMHQGILSDIVTPQPDKGVRQSFWRVTASQLAWDRPRFITHYARPTTYFRDWLYPLARCLSTPCDSENNSSMLFACSFFESCFQTFLSACAIPTKCLITSKISFERQYLSIPAALMIDCWPPFYRSFSSSILTHCRRTHRMLWRHWMMQLHLNKIELTQFLLFFNLLPSLV